MRSLSVLCGARSTGKHVCSLLRLFSVVIIAKMKLAVRVLLLLGLCAYSLALVR